MNIKMMKARVEILRRLEMGALSALATAAKDLDVEIDVDRTNDGGFLAIVEGRGSVSFRPSKTAYALRINYGRWIFGDDFWTMVSTFKQEITKL